MANTRTEETSVAAVHQFDELSTPVVTVDRDRLTENINAMQRTCSRFGVELRPHVKTHKMTNVARLQKQAGAAGFTCSRLDEAESMAAAGFDSLFIAHSLVDTRQAGRIAELAGRTSDFRVAATSEPQVEALANVATSAGIRLDVMMAVDTGLGREGARDLASADRLAAAIARHPRLQLRGLYTHEGHLYHAERDKQADQLNLVIEKLASIRDALGRELVLWPGCSVTAGLAAASGRVHAVRPGAYVFGDLYLTVIANVMPVDQAALTVLATVVDKPETGLALIDAGSKTFSSDRTKDNLFAAAADGRDLRVTAVHEEHGFVRGADVQSLQIGERIAFIPAHVCPVVNLAREVFVTSGGGVVQTWPVDCRGKTHNSR